MRQGVIGLIVAGSVIAAGLTELIVFRMVSPPDASAALLGGLWLAMPYLVAVMLAVMFRRQRSQGPEFCPICQENCRTAATTLIRRHGG